MTELVPVYDDLNFHLSEITVANKQYAADMNYLGNNIFQIHNLSESVLAYPSNTIFRSRGVAIFAKACFGHPSPSKRQKLNATANAFGAPAQIPEPLKCFR
jgi:hypothetical protein